MVKVHEGGGLGIAAQLHQKSQKLRLHGESDTHNHKDAEYLQAALNIM